ncbi:MAG: peptidase MA family metallohydrolase [Chloroflexota bacterium]
MTMIGRRWARLVLSVALGLGAVAMTPQVAQGASPEVGAPTATVRFLEGITFTGTAILAADVTRVELVVDLEGSTRSIVADVPTTVTSGPATLTWTLETPGGFLLPNTDVTGRFRLTLRDGSNVVGPSTTVRYDDTRFAWKTVTGDFVTVHWVDGGQTFGLRAMQIADEAVRAVATLLGVTERDPIDFYIYGDRTAFYDVIGPGARENVGGEAHPDIRTLFANISPDAVDDPWVGIVIPHELTHLVFDTAVRNAYHYPLRWLNEGIAVYLSEGYGKGDRSAVRDALKAGTLMPLRAIGAQFPTTQDRFFLAYSESVAAVSFLVDRYGRDAMVTLVRSYGGGLSDDEAFRTALGTDVAGFEAAWLDSIGAPTPSPLGPQPAPPGPVPAGWAGAAPTPGTVAGESPSASPVASLPPGSNPGGSTGDLGSGILPLIAMALGVVVVVALWVRRKSIRRVAPASATVVPASPPQPEAAADPGVTGGVPDDGAAGHGEGSR